MRHSEIGETRSGSGSKAEVTAHHGEVRFIPQPGYRPTLQKVGIEVVCRTKRSESFLPFACRGDGRRKSHAALEGDEFRKARTPFHSFVTSAVHTNEQSMEVAPDLFETAKSHFFDTSAWGAFCDVTLTLKQARQNGSGWVKIDGYRARQAFRHLMNLLNRAAYGTAFRRYGKRLRVVPVLEKGEVRARTLRSCERGTSGRWHIHCAIELPPHFDAIALEKLIRHCWAKVEWGYSRMLVRDGANAGWINYMLKDRQKSEFDGFLDCIIVEVLYNPIADAFVPQRTSDKPQSSRGRARPARHKGSAFCRRRPARASDVRACL